MLLKIGKIRIADFRIPSINVLLLLVYIVSVILFSMMPFGNVISKLVGLVLMYIFLMCVMTTDMKIYISREVYLIILWLVFCLISGIFATDITLVYGKIFTLLQLIIFFIVGYSIIVQSDLKIQTFLYIFNIAVAMAFLYGLITQGNPAVVVTRNRIVGTAGDPNQIAAYGAFAVLFSFYLFRIDKRLIFKIVNILFIAILMVGLIRTQSRQGFLIVFISGIMLLLLNYYNIYKNSENKWKVSLRIGVIIIILTVILSIIFYYFQQSDYYYRIQALVVFIKISFGSTADSLTKLIDYSAYERQKLIHYGIRMWLDHPIFGVGLDNFRIVIKDYWPISNRLYSHNNYIELLSTIGTIGTIIYYGIYLSIFKRFNGVLKEQKSKSNNSIQLIHILITVMVCILVLEFVTVTYYSKLTWILLTVIIAYSEKLLNNKPKANSILE